ncbi:MAG: TonB-dependent receptor plug domain-containing protein, partial [Erysipelotrichaceae bacterium]|nr:TonB-dependent receptor plug domain-containing protein [Erysipelotrichaceae bacterium]
MKKKILQILLLGMFLLLAGNTYAQINVSGNVRNSMGELLPGVTVIVKGTSIGVTTDLEGKYSVTAPNAESILVFSFVGMESQEFVIGASTQINVTMAESAIGLGEVVVTALGLKREKKALGYSVGEVKGEQLTETPQMSVLNALQGKVSGVRISQMNENVGSSVSIIIRGAKSLSGDNQPLFVVDGVPVANTMNNLYKGVDMGNAISDLNPDDVESVSVLKGASAAALYGSRAGNGVILITTRSGQIGKKGIGVSVNSSTVFDIMTDIYPFQTKFASGDQAAHAFVEVENESW